MTKTRKTWWSCWAGSVCWVLLSVGVFHGSAVSQVFGASGQYLSGQYLSGQYPSVQAASVQALVDDAPGSSGVSSEGEPSAVAAAAAALEQWALGSRAYAEGDHPLVGDGTDLQARLTDLLEALGAQVEDSERLEAFRSADALGLLRSCVSRAGLGGRPELVNAALAMRSMMPPGADAEAIHLATLAAELAEPLADPARGAGGAAWRAVVRDELRFIATKDVGRASALGHGLHRRARALGLGNVAPRFAGHDTDGNEVRSVDLVGHVVIHRFWDGSVPASIRAHERDLALFRRHWNAPVELVGVSSSSDRSDHLAGFDDRKIGGIQVFDGPLPATLVDARARTGLNRILATRNGEAGSVETATEAFVRPLPGTVIVVDSRGIVRGRDLCDRALDQLVGKLVDEHRAFLRAQIVARSAASHEER